MKGSLLIQILLIAGALGLCLAFVRRWDRAHTRAWKRIAFFAFVLANVYAVLRPKDITWIANKLGVGRGTDLVLYLLVLAVSFFALNTYLRFKSLERKITDLARSVAIRDGQLVNQVRLTEKAAEGSGIPETRKSADTPESPETSESREEQPVP